MLLIILVKCFCPLKIKILLPNFLVDSFLIHLIISPPPLSSNCIEVKTHYHDVLLINKSVNAILILICTTIPCCKALFLFLAPTDISPSVYKLP